MPVRPAPGHRRAPARPTTPTLAASWEAMPWSMRILRAFLGGTFVFAGVQKFMDPNFLHAGSGTYIGTQLQGFAHGTPVAPLMNVLAKFPLVTGVGVAITEIAVGLATLLGVGLMVAATVGLLINLTLWLSATWHIHPYFLGSDSIYAVAWLALLAGALEAERSRFPGRMPSMSERVDHIGRREVLRGGLIAGASVAMAVLGSTLAGAPTTKIGLGGGAMRAQGGSRSQPTTGTSTTGGTGTTEAPQSQPSGQPAGQTQAPAVQGRVLTTLDQLPVGAAVGFTAAGGTPAALVRLADGRVVAYSRVCTHAGCSVGYDSSAHLLVCPCHGAEFDPAKRAQPLAGSPTSTPLQYIRVVVDQATGQVILPQ
jgi:thiosulfate dehydrogenase (quinone) large subunit